MFEKLKSIDDAPFNLLLLADPSMDMVLEKLNKGECFLYKVGSEVLGCYVLNELTRDRVELANIAVSEKNQGCGIGKKLLLHVFNYAKASGYSEIVVGTGNSSIGQIAFYQKAGFRMVEINRGFFERHYSEKIYENGILCRDMIMFSKPL
ncbi:GNAT family N-acetyltransferase [Staphylococcus arlettae]|uniref:GNAT family N-acetyltransferase n=1 Tax=Staphylococcus arlettae TaxID=29378 RepID=UPI001E55560A|nr:GNAT family N-acetyltransferase [Staphylococcus arlettae]MCD8839313.1 GNAT family N-acetyltransferase [Staphylococcus arlettae]MCD8849045.1 GNAT family N-acetyltransferase [Staphylococcus arlettae]MCD8866905.1 GNAT family N-acetyltransferase [Staphylococcus arlettae]MCD8906944.1 GNAT family N-acetyltransferase [Staphylococcus arlettae]MEB6065849.1 GNAT family N-acetyltransferase [Staphylococcus arlettae]